MCILGRSRSCSWQSWWTLATWRVTFASSSSKEVRWTWEHDFGSPSRWQSEWTTWPTLWSESNMKLCKTFASCPRRLWSMFRHTFNWHFFCQAMGFLDAFIILSLQMRKEASGTFLSEMIFLHLSKKDFVLNKMQNTASQTFPHSQVMSIFVGGCTLRLTAGREFGCPFLENQLAGLRALFSYLTAHLWPPSCRQCSGNKSWFTHIFDRIN